MGNTIAPTQQNYNSDTFRINRILLVESENFIKKLGIKLMDKIKSAVSPNSGTAAVAKGRAYCREANYILETRIVHTLQTFKEVLYYLDLALNEFSIARVKFPELYDACFQDYKTARNFLDQKYKEEAEHFEHLAQPEINNGYLEDAKYHLLKAAEYYDLVGYTAKGNEVRKRAFNCQRDIDFNQAENFYNQAEKCMKNEDFCSAFENINKAKQKYELSGRKDFLTKCNNLNNQCIQAKAKMAERCNAEATKFYNVGVSLYCTNNCIPAINELNKAIAQFKKASNSEQVAKCENFIRNVKILQTANENFDKAQNLAKQQRPVEALKLAQDCKCEYEKRNFQKMVNACNDFIIYCNDLMNVIDISGDLAIQKGKTCFSIGDFVNAKTHFQTAKNGFQSASKMDRVKECDQLLNNCERVLEANRNYSEAQKAKAQGDLDQAEYLFNLAKQTYAMFEITTFVTYCNNNIAECRNLKSNFANICDNIFSTGVQNFNNRHYENAKDNFIQAKANYTKAGNQIGVNNCNQMIYKCGQILLANINYQQGLKYRENKDYDKAVGLFKAAKQTYLNFDLTKEAKDCDEQILKCGNGAEFDLGIEDIEQGDFLCDKGDYSGAIDSYNAAISHFDKTEDYGMVKKCRNYIKFCSDRLDEELCKEYDENLNWARTYYERGEYDRARRAVEDARVGWYNDRECDELLKEIDDAEDYDRRQEEESDDDEYEDDTDY